MKYYTITFLCLLGYLNINAQDLYVNNGSVEYNDVVVPSINLYLTPEVGAVRDGFEKWMRKNHDVRLNGKKLLFFNRDVMTAEGEVMPQISDDEINLFVKPTESSDDISCLSVFASYNDNQWISPESNYEDYQGLKDLVTNFAKSFVPQYYYQKLEEAEDTIEDLASDKNDMKDDIDNRQDRINELEKEIMELKSRISAKDKKINEAQEILERQRKAYENAKVRVSRIQ